MCCRHRLESQQKYKQYLKLANLPMVFYFFNLADIMKVLLCSPYISKSGFDLIVSRRDMVISRFYFSVSGFEVYL